MDCLKKVSVCLCLVSTSHPGRQALLEGGPYGEAAVVEVAYQLWVYGAAELGHLPMCRSDEDTLYCLHHDVVEQGVLRT